MKNTLPLILGLLLLGGLSFWVFYEPNYVQIDEDSDGVIELVDEDEDGMPDMMDAEPDVSPSPVVAEDAGVIVLEGSDKDGDSGAIYSEPEESAVKVEDANPADTSKGSTISPNFKDLPDL